MKGPASRIVDELDSYLEAVAQACDAILQRAHVDKEAVAVVEARLRRLGMPFGAEAAPQQIEAAVDKTARELREAARDAAGADACANIKVRSKRIDELIDTLPAERDEAQQLALLASIEVKNGVALAKLRHASEEADAFRSELRASVAAAADDVVRRSGSD